MLKCLIIEDDYAFSLELKIMAESIGLHVAEVVNNFSGISSALKDNQVDVILSDVKLDSGNYSFDYFKGKQNLPPIIFFSSYKDQEQYNNCKDINPYMYIVKPFDKITLRSAVDGALRSKKKAMSKGGDLHREESTIFVRSKGKLISIDLASLIFIESEGNYCTFNFKNRKVAIRSSIKNVLNEINNDQFIQVQRAFVVNLKQIKEIKVAKSEIILENDIIPLGRKYKKDVIDLLYKSQL